MPVGSITRGTTGTNRLRRVDRWIMSLPILRRTSDPLVVDLGYGARGVTTLEMHGRLRGIRPDISVLGLEIDPERVRTAHAELERVRSGETPFDPDAAVAFARGGFEVPGRPPAVIRAFNVLRQYDESAVPDAWRMMTQRLQPGGVLVEGTCNEIGRVCTWVTVDAGGPQTLTISLRLEGLEQPSVAAERLPKALIHHNVAAEPVHALLNDLDMGWATHAGLGIYSPAQRWIATVTGLKSAGWPVLHSASRWRLGEVTVPWASVAPLGS